MADNLPEPKSRKESYLAKAAGMETTIPETPESREEQYLAAIAEGGGGGGTSDFDQLTNRPKYNGTAMTGETNIPAAPTVSQTTGSSTTDVMSQNATTSMVYADPGTNTKVQIGSSASAGGENSIAIGTGAKGNDTNAICIGTGNANYGSVFVGRGTPSSGAMGYNSTAIGNQASTHKDATTSTVIGFKADTGIAAYYSVGLGAHSHPIAQGEVNIGLNGTGSIRTKGFNNSAYRIIRGLYDGQEAHDAATLAQGNTLATSAPTTSTVGVLGQLYTDTTNMHTYQCTAIDTTDPDNPSYTWTQRW